MFSKNDPMTREIRTRLQATCMGLGLVRLLQDARRIDEARAVLGAMEKGSEDAPKASAKASRLQRGSRNLALVAVGAERELQLAR